MAADASEIRTIPAYLDKPHITPAQARGLAKCNAGKPLAELNGDPTPILTRLESGERAKDIAKELGIGHEKLYAWLLRNCPDQWQAISAGKALARIESAETAIDEAQDSVSISKARESHRMGQWTLERTAKRLYGDSKADSGGVTVQVLVQRDGSVETNVVESGE